VTSAKGLRTRLGRPYPPGATWDGAGVNFALFSEHATGVELCLLAGDLAQARSRSVRIAPSVLVREGVPSRE